MIAIRFIAVIALLHTDLADDDSILGGDAKRYEAIAHTDGTAYRDFEVEYPPITLGLLKLVVGSDLASTHLRLAVSQLALDLGTAGVLAWAFKRRSAIAYLVLGTPMVFFPFPYMRNDLLAVFLATLALGLVRKGRDRTGGAALAIAAFAKVWPVVVAPVLIVERKARGLVAWGLTGIAGIGMWVWWAGTAGIDQTTTFRGARGFQIESLVGTVIHAVNPGGSHMEQGAWRTSVAVPSMVRTALILLAVVTCGAAWWLAYRARQATPSTAGTHGGPGGEMAEDRISYGLASMASVIALLVFSTIISPQYILWLLPFAAIVAASGDRAVGWLTFAIAAFTTLELATIHGQIEGRLYAIAPLLARNALLVVVLVILIKRLATAARTATTSPCA